MKLHADAVPSLNTVTAYGPGFIEINRERHGGPVLLMPEGPVRIWTAQSVEQLDEAAFEALRALEPEIVLVGTGPTQRFLHPRLTAPLSRMRIGVDLMDSRAACRTYNILMAEGRRVLAALLPL